MDQHEIEKLAENDKQYVWHPFTQMDDWIDNEPVVIAEAEGITLKDTRGRSYLDGVSSLWTNVHGHRVPELDEAVRGQLDKIAHSTLLGLGSVPSIKLAEKLVKITPAGLEKVFYSDSGSTAVEVALKMAFQYWRQNNAPEGKKIRFACLENAYHGDTIGSVSVGGIDLFHSMYKPLLFDAIKLPSPHCYRCPLGLDISTCGMECAEQAEKIIRAHSEELAAVVMEPLVQGAAGIIIHPEGFLERIAGACAKNGVFLILDEVATGFGRTAKLFACEHEGVEPDFMSLAKGLSGGYLPLAATMATHRVFEGFLGSIESMKTFFHGHTYTGNPLACAAALANLGLFDSHDLIARVSERAGELAELLDGVREIPVVGNVRRKGLMVGIELVKDRASKERFPGELRVGHRVIMEARKRGAMFRPLGDVLVVMPPLSVSRDELVELMKILVQSIQAVSEEL